MWQHACKACMLQACLLFKASMSAIGAGSLSAVCSILLQVAARLIDMFVQYKKHAELARSPAADDVMYAGTILVYAVLDGLMRDAGQGPHVGEAGPQPAVSNQYTALHDISTMCVFAKRDSIMCEAM
jgi:hypothetical protein